MTNDQKRKKLMVFWKKYFSYLPWETVKHLSFKFDTLEKLKEYLDIKFPNN
jgi:hypothetical protein